MNHITIPLLFLGPTCPKRHCSGWQNKCQKFVLLCKITIISLKNYGNPRLAPPMQFLEHYSNVLVTSYIYVLSLQILHREIPFTCHCANILRSSNFNKNQQIFLFYFTFKYSTILLPIHLQNFYPTNFLLLVIWKQKPSFNHSGAIEGEIFLPFNLCSIPISTQQLQINHTPIN